MKTPTLTSTEQVICLTLRASRSPLTAASLRAAVNIKTERYFSRILRTLVLAGLVHAEPQADGTDLFYAASAQGGAQ